MKTIFITITGGFGIRNLFGSDAFKILKSEKDLRIVIFAPFMDNKSIIADLPEAQGENIIFENLAMYQPNIAERVLRKMAEIVFFNINYAGTIRIKEATLKNENYPKYLWVKLVKKILGKNRNFIKSLERLDILLSRYKYKKYKRPFEKYKPSLVVSTDFLHLYEWGLVKTAKQSGLPVISIIANWDHFTKGRPPKSDKFIVWNEFNKKQLIEYDRYRPEDILVAGIPHQDYFARARGKFLSKKKFLKSIGATEDKKLITYTTARRSRDEPDILEIVCEAIKNGKIKYPSHLHVRIHPEDNPGRYKKLKKYGDIITFEVPRKTVSQRFWSGKMIMTAAERSAIWCPDEEEMINYANLLARTDVTVNVTSSVTLDAAALDIPIVNIAFDGYAQREFIESNARLFTYTHFESIPKSGGARTAKNADELIKFINMYLDNPKLDSVGRRRIVVEQCGKLDGKCGERIAKFILNFLGSVRGKNKKSRN